MDHSSEDKIQKALMVLWRCGSHEEEVDVALLELQTALKQHHDGLSTIIFNYANDIDQPIHFREHCLEALSGARLPELVWPVSYLVNKWLVWSDDDMAFKAIAAAGELPPSAQELLKPSIRPFIAKGGHLGRAAQCFCDGGVK